MEDVWSKPGEMKSTVFGLFDIPGIDTLVCSGTRFTYGHTYISLTLWTYLAKCVYPLGWIADPEIV